MERAIAVEDVIALHAEIIRRTGGERGLLNRSILAASLSRAYIGHLDRPTSLAERAAFLLRGIGRDHPFVDGNKRAAWETADFFLSHHGWYLEAAADEAEAFMLGVAAVDEVLGFEEIVQWVQTHMAKVFDELGGHNP